MNILDKLFEEFCTQYSDEQIRYLGSCLGIAPYRMKDVRTAGQWFMPSLMAGRDLQGADLRGADFTGADFTSAKLNGARVRGTTGIA